MPSKKDEEAAIVSALLKDAQSLEASSRQADKAISRIQKPNQ